MASVLFMVVLTHEWGSSLDCSANTTHCLEELLPELILSGACNDTNTWCEAVARGEFLPVDTMGTCQLQ